MKTHACLHFPASFLLNIIYGIRLQLPSRFLLLSKNYTASNQDSMLEVCS